METKKQNYVLPIVVMIFLFGMISFVTNLASPMGDILKYQFNVPNWMGTLGVFANFIAHAIMGYPAVSASRRCPAAPRASASTCWAHSSQVSPCVCSTRSSTPC